MLIRVNKPEVTRICINNVLKLINIYVDCVIATI